MHLQSRREKIPISVQSVYQEKKEYQTKEVISRITQRTLGYVISVKQTIMNRRGTKKTTFLTVTMMKRK
jgi:hypothetical protein